MANHGWTWVRQAPLRPNRCAVFPHIQQGALIDTGTDILTHDPHIYIGETAAKELGKMVGMVPRSDLDQAKAELSGAEEVLNDLMERIAELEQFKAAVTLVKAGIGA